MTHGSVFDLERVSISYGSVPAVRDVTMSIPHVGITAFIGPSGCGNFTATRGPT